MEDEIARDGLEEALSAYLSKNGHLPCPARRDLADGNAAFGAATDCTGNLTCTAGSAPSGTADVLPAGGVAANDCVRIGGVPVKTLGLPLKYAYDGWGRRLTYAAIKKTATTSASYDGFTTTLTNGVLNVTDAAGATLSTEPVGYIVVSHGQDGKGAFLPSGQRLDCIAGSKDTENCDDDTTFIQTPVNDQASGTNFYYDFTQWKTCSSDEECEEQETFAAGSEHACAIKPDDTLWCWGGNFYSQLGDNTTTSRSTPVQVKGMGGAGFLTNVAQVSAHHTTCVLKKDKTVWCWGAGASGGLGDNTTTARSTPVQVLGVGGTGFLTEVTQISVGRNSGCAVKDNGTLWCWGLNDAGQAGDNTTTNRLTPVQVLGVGGTGFLTDVAQVSSGALHRCALKKTDGSVWCWGYNGTGELGDNTLIDRKTPVQVKGPGGTGFFTDVARISAGFLYTCALKTDKTVWCWGSNSNGRLGDNTSTDRKTPVQVVGTGGAGFLTDVIQVDATTGQGHHTCAVKSDNTTWCWGYNLSGQLGDNTATSRSAPVQVKGVGATGFHTGVSRVVTGYATSCSMKTNGDIHCWGDNARGTLGNGTTTDSKTPVAVTNGTGYEVGVCGG